MQKKYNQGFRIARLIAKLVGLPVALVGILIFVIQTDVGVVGTIVLFVGSLGFALDTEWTTFDDCKALCKEIKEHLRLTQSNRLLLISGLQVKLPR